ncbi:SDR family NAD(P)-dependent oxidoreductase [Arhodomonas aquaeolei]|uniref:SDR family NAD(P)-dependent oxidoreductase n=1 Tax=Arhodomonas aquaeolei TaxID=2369 RepID=UPI002166DC34|nr:SDR family NAD(P)-dependent oxidoreductase [Arhodomonas aquaeolei]MCS4504140.1 SDR family NAD(P)-dependent oxidoreductase [Arhodomonas aquaeolei]
MRLDGKVFLVTGAGSGLGGATARELVGCGARVVLADLNGEALAALAQELGDAAVACEADVTDEAAVTAAVAKVREAFGALHGLVNCAGVVHGERVLNRGGDPHGLESFARVVQINLVGSFNCLRVAAAAMADNEPDAEGERGVVINTASVAAFDGQVGQAAYAASKAGVAGLTLPLARDLADRGIRVMTIAPGIFETPMMAGLPEKVRESLGEQTPFPPRLGRPAEYAALVRHICENVMLNGEVIRLDGAIRMAPR